MCSKCRQRILSSLSSCITACQIQIILYSSFWGVGVNTNRSVAQPPIPPPPLFNRAASNSSRDAVTCWESVMPPSLELPLRTNAQLTALPRAPPGRPHPPPLFAARKQSVRGCRIREGKRGAGEKNKRTGKRSQGEKTACVNQRKRVQRNMRMERGREAERRREARPMTTALINTS